MKTAKKKKVYCRTCPKWEIKIPERCSNTIESKTKGAKKLYFCTSRCKERYIKAPEKFV